MPVSSRGYFVMAKEADNAVGEVPSNRAAVAGSNTWWAYPAEEIEFMPGKEFIDFQEIRGSRQAYTTLDGVFRPTAMVKGAVYPGVALAQFLYGTLGDVRIFGVDSVGETPENTDPDAPGFAFGSTAGTDTTPGYELLFSDGAKLPNWTLERSDGRDGNATIVEQSSGCKVESLQFSANFGEKVDMTVNFQGAKKPATISTSSALNANNIIYPSSDVVPLYFNRAAIQIGGVKFGYMKSVSFEMSNTITRQEVFNSDVTDNYKVSETLDSWRLFEGGMECTLSGTAVFDNLTLYNKVISGETASMELWFASNSDVDTDLTGSNKVPYLLYFKWPKVKVSRASLPFRAGEVIESDVEFKVIYDPAATISGWGTGTGTAPVTGGSVFVKMIADVPGTLSNGVLRPSFY